MATATLASESRSAIHKRFVNATEFGAILGITPSVASKYLNRSEAAGLLRARRLQGCRPLWDLEAALKLAAQQGATVPEFSGE